MGDHAQFYVATLRSDRGDPRFFFFSFLLLLRVARCYKYIDVSLIVCRDLEFEVN
jgi:hypothetical protein